MWPLWVVAVCSALAALCSRGVSNESTPGNNQTSLENGSSRTGEGQDQSGHWSGKWGPRSTLPPPTTPLQNSTDYKAGGAVAPTISVLVENGTCTFLLTCALAEGAVGKVAFSWQLANGSEVLSNGPTLRITWSPQQGAPDYVCTVRGQGAHGSSRVSLREHCQEDRPITDKGISASFYAKSIVPILVVMVALAVLFLMYRRKRGRETHSSMESINESSVSESDHEARSSTADQVAEAGFLPQAWKPFSPDDGDTPEVTAAIAHPEPPRA